MPQKLKRGSRNATVPTNTIPGSVPTTILSTDKLSAIANPPFGLKLTDEIAASQAPSVFIHPWTPEEDKAMAQAKSRFGSNWELIADILNSLPKVFVKRSRSKKHCLDHFKSISASNSSDLDPSANSDSNDTFASYFQTVVTNPTFSIAEYFKKIPPSASSNSSSSSSAISAPPASTVSPPITSTTTKQKGRSARSSSSGSSNALNSSNVPLTPSNSSSDPNFLIHASHHTVASLAATIPFSTPQISGFNKSRNPSDIALFKLQKEREKRDREVHPTLVTPTSNMVLNSGNIVPSSATNNTSMGIYILF